MTNILNPVFGPDQIHWQPNDEWVDGWQIGCRVPVDQVYTYMFPEYRRGLKERPAGRLDLRDEERREKLRQGRAQ